MVAPLASACKGGEATMAATQALGWFAFVIHAGLALASYVLWRANRDGQPSLFVLAALLALHPAWTLSAYNGDCGMIKVLATFLWMAIAGVCFAVQLNQSRRSRT
jgi:hypothetical protein